MRMVSFVLIVIFITFNFILGEIFVPLKWHSEGYFNQYFPRDYRLFDDGYIGAKVEFLKIKKSNYYFTQIVGSYMYLQMGYQYEDVVFDPRNTEYSLILASRLNKIKELSFGEIGLLHNCFHDIDRFDGQTEIWNVIYLKFSNINYSMIIQKFKEKNFKNELLYNLELWYFPYWGVYDWIQNIHNFHYAFRLELDKNLFARGRHSFLVSTKLHIFFSKNNWNITHLNKYGIKYRYIGEEGIFELLIGYLTDNQNIKPVGQRGFIGLYFYY